MSYDIVLRDGKVADGSGAEPIPADVAIRDGRVAAVTEPGEIADANSETVIDATGRIVMPGFVDTHVHAEAVLDRPETQLAMLRQGITTVLLGQDGLSFAPASGVTVSAISRYFAAVNGSAPPEWSNGVTVAGLLSSLHRRTPLNVGYLVPLGTVRHDVLGPERRPARDDLPMMVQTVRRSLEEGALGVSTGLEYVPGGFADLDELVALTEPAADHDAVYVSHLRSYADGRAPGMPEALEITRRAGVGLHVSHYRGWAEPLLGQLDGADVTYDSYPHLYANTILAMKALPPDVQEGGVDATLARLAAPATRDRLATEWFPSIQTELSGTIIGYVAAEQHRWMSGLSIPAAADRVGVPYQQLVLDLLIDSNLVVNCVVPPAGAPAQLPGEQEVRELARDPRHLGCSDGIYLGDHPHPRGWGAFARFLGRFTRELGDWTWGQAARHLAGHAAERFGLAGRGRLTVGAIADIAVVEPDRVIDRADYDRPRLLAEGVSDVLVAGVPVLSNGELTGATPGRALRRGEETL